MKVKHPQPIHPATKCPVLVKAIVIVNILGWLSIEGVWIYLRLNGQIPAIHEMDSCWEKAYIGLVKGFTVADAVWSNIFLLAGRTIAGWPGCAVAVMDG